MSFSHIFKCVTGLGIPIGSSWAQFLEVLGADLLREHTRGGVAASLAPLASQVLLT